MHMIEISWALSVPKATSLRQQCWPSRCELPSVLSRRSRCRGASDSTDAGHRRVLERSICGGVPLEPRVESIYGLKDALDGGGTLVLKGAAMKLTSPSLSERCTDLAKAEKSFRRNCSDVLAGECTAAEKADVHEAPRT